MALDKTKITEQFEIVGNGGEKYTVQEHTRYVLKTVDGKKTEVLGRAYLLTVEGKGVLKTHGQNTYSIPSLGLQSLQRLSSAS